MKQKQRRWIALLLSIAFAAALPVSVLADDENSGDENETSITETENEEEGDKEGDEDEEQQAKTGLAEDGTLVIASEKYTDQGNGWSWDGSTLTLSSAATNNVKTIDIEIESAVTIQLSSDVTLAWKVEEDDAWCYIYSPSNLTVNLNGYTLTADNTTNSRTSGLYCEGDLTIKNGTLISDRGIYVLGDLTIQDANLNVNGTGTGILANGELQILGNSNVTASSERNSGLGCGTIVIDTTGTVTSTGNTLNENEVTFAAGGNIIVQNGTVIMDGSTSGDITVNGGSLTINGDVTDIMTNYNQETGEITTRPAVVIVSGGSLTVTGDIDGSLTVTSGYASVSGNVTGSVTDDSSVEDTIVNPPVISEDTSSVTTVTKKDGWTDMSAGSVYYKNGIKAKGWQEIDGETYYFDQKGYLQTGWIELEDGWHYLDPDGGAQQTGWQKIGNTWFYLDNETGVMENSGIKTIDGETYYFYDWGGMASSCWYLNKDTGVWYYFRGNGAMAKSAWVEWKGEYYYCGADGKMLTSTTTPDGYRVDQNGKWIR